MIKSAFQLPGETYQSTRLYNQLAIWLMMIMCGKTDCVKFVIIVINYVYGKMIYWICIYSVLFFQATLTKDVVLSPNHPKELMLQKHADYIASYGINKDEYVSGYLQYN